MLGRLPPWRGQEISWRSARSFVTSAICRSEQRQEESPGTRQGLSGAPVSCRKPGAQPGHGEGLPFTLCVRPEVARTPP